MKRKLIFKIIIRILSGVMDTITPNVKNSILQGEYNPTTNKQNINVDWVRLLSSFVVFILLVLNFVHLIDLNQVVKSLGHELQNLLPQ